MPRLIVPVLLSSCACLLALLAPDILAQTDSTDTLHTSQQPRILQVPIEPTARDSAELPVRNPTEWPYGGTIDTTWFLEWMKHKPLIFEDVVNFNDVHFSKAVDFAGAEFKQSANFNGTRFSRLADFRYVDFDGEFNSISAIYDEEADFEAVAFKVHANFKHSKFATKPNFDWAEMPPKMSFENCKFHSVLDLRLADMRRVRQIFLESVDIESGNFLVEWKQLQAINDTFRIDVKIDEVLHELEPSKQDQYNRLRNIYLALRNNFLAQDDGKGAADDVMYELHLREDELVGGFWLNMYGIFFGYGYQPWRFLLFVVLPLIIVFAAFWYFAYYRLVAPKVLDNFDELVSEEGHDRADGTGSKDNDTMWLTNTTWQRPNSGIRDAIPGLARLWHVLFFSTSVLLGLRFSKEWLSTSNDKFNYWVTFQWILGVSLYICFGVFVQGSKFDYVKGLLGF